MKLVLLHPFVILLKGLRKRGIKMNDEKNRRKHERVTYNEFTETEQMAVRRTDAIKLSKFIQIAAGNDHLYALDELGKIWSYHPVNKQWEGLGDARKD